MRNVVEVENVDQHFRTGFWMRRTQVLHGVSLTVPEGTIFGFLGANGAGKTTLIHLITGLRRPTGGRVRIEGFDAGTPEARARIGYLPERPYFHEHLTGYGLLIYLGALSGLSRTEVMSRAPGILRSVGLPDAGDTDLKRYSKGMLQRIGVAQALLHDARILVLDEPMSGLDPLGRKEIRELIVHLASEGRTIFFSTHVIPDAEAICDQVAVIRKGRIVGCGPIQQFLAKGPIRTEISFGGVSKETAESLPGLVSIRKIPEGFRAIVSGDQPLNAQLRALLDLNAEVHWATPIRPSLEALFEEGGAAT